MRWPHQLAIKLKEEGYGFGTVQIIAKTGWTTRNLLDHVPQRDLTNFDMVSLLIGVNNQYQGLDFSIYEQELDSLLDIAIEAVGDAAKVFVVSIPDYGVTPFGQAKREKTARELDQYNTYAQTRCVAKGIAFVNITHILRMLGDSEKALAADQLHPSGHQYGLWVNEILPIAKQILENIEE